MAQKLAAVILSGYLDSHGVCLSLYLRSMLRSFRTTVIP
jgi:hypothetical protein